jgi:exopolyphosphatase/guanosine-5'-triphosphate,3'-diphosphate pyrophosphatase
MDEVITHAKLKRLQKQAMQADHLEELDIDGLTLERALVFPSGLSILIAIFELLNIDSMTLAGGALREGMVYDMVKELQQDDIRARTINSVQTRCQLDVEYGDQVAATATSLLVSCGNERWIEEPHATVLLEAASKLHEIGLTLDFKKAGEHSAYLLQNLDLPGFTRAQKHLLAEVVRRYKDQLTPLPSQHALSTQSAERVLRLLRLSVIITHRRQRALQPQFSVQCEGNSLTLSIDKQWLEAHPLSAAELEIESNRQSDAGWPLTIQAV